jgi:hypothetical protein
VTSDFDGRKDVRKQHITNSITEKYCSTMPSLTILLIFICYIANIEAFVPKLLIVRKKITGNIVSVKKYGPSILSASASTSVFTNMTRNSDEKLYTFYKLACNDQNIKEVFVGYTSLTLKITLNVHKNKYKDIKSTECNRGIYKVVRANGGWSDWSIKILEKCYFHDKVEADIKKREWMKKNPFNVNTKRPIVTAEENKEYHDKYNIEYNIDNRVSIAKRKKEYYSDNEAWISERHKNYRIINKDVIAEKRRKYYIDNKAKILERCREAYKKKKMEAKESDEDTV